MSIKQTYDIKKIKDGQWKHSLSSEHDAFSIILPFDHKVEKNAFSTCIFCNTKRYKKDSLVCKSCKPNHEKLVKDLRKYFTFLASGVTNQSKLKTSSAASELEKYGKEGLSHSEKVNITLSKNGKDKHSILKRKEHAKYGKNDLSSLEKRKITNQKRYGVENISQSTTIKNKKKKTTLKNFGVENPTQSLHIQEKTKQTNLKKYGVESPSQSDIVKEKTKQTNLKKYGVEYHLQSDHTKEKNIVKKYGMPFEKFHTIWLDDYYKYGLYYCLKKYDLSYSHLLKKFIPQKDKNTSTSLCEEEVKNSIDLDFETNVRKILPSNGRLEIDLLNREHMVSIEFNGAYWHQIHSDKLEQDLSKAEEMREIGYKHFALDETDMSKLELLNKMINPNKIKLYARKLELKLINNPKEFLDKNHLQGSVRAKISYGLFLDDELIQTMTFGKSRFDKNIDWEILRLCTKPDCLVVGGAERLFKAFMKEYNPSSVVSYSDNKYFDGKVYGKLGLKFVENTQSNYVWWKNGISLKRYQTMKHKLINVLGDKFDSEMTEKENMLNSGWIQIKDLGNKKWICDFCNTAMQKYQ